VVVRAASEASSRRAALGGLLAGVAALAAGPALALDLVDQRDARARGFDIIYEARELTLPQSERDGLDQARGDLAATRKRVEQSQAQINGELSGFVGKAYWTEAREQLRRQVGTLRFDLNTLAAQLPKDQRKAAKDLQAAFVSEVSALDFAIRKKDPVKAAKELQDTKDALAAVIAALA
jgi:photosystem II oxygen-evolving enhancer protein 3